jgi:hypothetical protein
MDELDRAQMYNTAWLHWGADAQLDMCIEEMAELTQAILKNRRRGVTFSLEFVEELADVLICLEQVETRLKKQKRPTGNATLWDAVLEIKEQKLERLKGRVFDSLSTKFPDVGYEIGSDR